MKKIKYYTVLFVLLIVSSCSSTKSLQEYYVDNSENPNFISLDIPASILNLEKADLTKVQKEAIQSLKKLNILAFKKTAENDVDFKIEKKNVTAILKNAKFTELMKMNTPYGKATVKYIGSETAIDEVIIFGNDDKKGFALIRILGNDMNPAHLIQLLKAIQKSDYKGEGLEKIGALLKG